MLSDVVGKQEAWLTATRRFSSEAQVAELDKALASAEVTRALELRTIALNKAQEGGFGVKPTDWFTAQTKRIEILRQVETRRRMPCSHIRRHWPTTHVLTGNLFWRSV
jgi:hypothetical protein